ncbi:primase-helicase family protein [Caulifigura coniformis]|nr:primase-helicase family protein [Caulifigura coniformis]
MTRPELVELPDWEPELIGVTGFDPEGYSTFGGVDIDGLNHAAGLTPERIAEIIAALKPVKFVRVQRSKSGRGIHLLFRWHPDRRPRASTGSDHARNCERAIREIERQSGLKLIGGDADCFGQVLWIWSKNPAPNGFEVLQEETEFVPDELLELPARQPVPATNDVSTVDFDPQHSRLIDEWSQTNYAVITDTLTDGRRCVRLHTLALGVPTTSEGKDPRTPNAYGFPLPGGGFIFFRFGDVAEIEPWFRTKTGKTCLLIGADIEFAARMRLRSNKGVFLGTVREIAAVVPGMNTAGFEDRPGELDRDGDQWIVSVASRKEEPLPPGWVKQGYKALFFVDAPVEELSEQIYAVVEEATADGAEMGDFMRMVDGEPRYFNERQLENDLDREGKSRDQIAVMKRSAVVLQKRVAHLRPSRIEGKWLNIGARYIVTPQAGEHPTWTMLDEHVGQTVTPHLPPWCLEHGIRTGGDWMRLWRCVAFQRPDRPTPFVTLVSKLQGTGKTTYVNALKLLVTGGIAGATGMLRKNSQFNSHVMRSWLAIIVESDISRDGTYDLLKPLISDDDAECEAKFKTATVAQNFCHFVQTVNHLRYCPLGEPGDTRIAVVRVPPIQNEIDRDELKRRLQAEAPAYLHTLLNTTLPPPAGRLWLPIPNTPERQLLIDMRTAPLERFLAEKVDEIPHNRIPAGEFVDRYQTWFLEVMGKGTAPGKQEVLADLRSFDTTLKYVGDHHGAYVVNGAWK